MAAIIILVHGMGKRKPGTFTRDFKIGINKGLELLGAADSDWLSEVEIREFYYADTFKEHREKLAANAEAIRNGTLPVSNWMSQLYNKVGKIDEFIGEDNAFTQSWLGIAFYCHTFLGEQIRVELASEICKAINDAENHSDVHVLSYSLGTAVLHDTLHKLFRDDASFRDKIPGFPTGSFNLGSVTTIANISRLTNLINFLENPYKSRCTTGLLGCTDRFVNVSNAFDPFLWLRSYSPDKNPNYVPAQTNDLKFNAIKSWNPHNFINYLAYPEVTLRLLTSYTSTLDMGPLLAKRQSARQHYENDSVIGAASKFEATLSAFGNNSDDVTFKELSLIHI